MLSVIYLGLGSNLGPSTKTLFLALDHISQNCGIAVINCSSLYRSKPLLHLSRQNSVQADYINAVARCEFNGSAIELLDKLQATENYFARDRKVGRWGARTLDLDILLFRSERINNERLTVPHIGMLTRDFVLIPLFEIAPKIEIPGFGPISNALLDCENRGLEKLNEYYR